MDELTASDFEPSPGSVRVIHCSAGVGRSGTFIALDYLLFLLHTGQLDDITHDQDPVAETVDMLRQQRMMMVQGEAQFGCLYDVLKEEWERRASSVDDAASASPSRPPLQRAPSNLVLPTEYDPPTTTGVYPSPFLHFMEGGPSNKRQVVVEEAGSTAALRGDEQILEALKVSREGP